MSRPVSPALLGLIASCARLFVFRFPMLFDASGSAGLLGSALVMFGAVISVGVAIRERGRIVPRVAAAVGVLSVVWVVLVFYAAA